MDNSNVKNLLINIPVKLCRNMNQRLIYSILRDLPYDLSQHHFAILKLLNEIESVNITEVVEKLSITRPQMTASADKLVKFNYINRENKYSDRRKLYLSLTKEGREVVEIIDQRISILTNEILAELSDSELKQLEQGLIVLEKLCINSKEKNDEASI